MSQNTNSSGGGVSILGLLGVLFIGLKLTGYIGWSWWWVTAPLWGGAALALIAIIVALAVALFMSSRGVTVRYRGRRL